ncbi:MAG: D-2-hydroxyacid dehydrogenase family protein [Pseudomonadota bacterium]|nr:D-2-hydroxyacid dehydrogenase family protein [Pseudomonadota bacterium]
MRIAVLDDYQGVARDFADWESLGDDVTVFRDTVSGPALVERLRPFEVVCLMRERTPVRADLLAELPNLRLLVTTGMWNASVDVAAATARGVTVCGTEGYGPATAHLCMTLILVATRRMLPDMLGMRQGAYQRTIGRDLGGLTLGLLGLGKLGQEVARLATPFGMKPLAWSTNLTRDKAAAAGVEYAPSLDELMARSDVLSIHLVLSERSRGLVGAHELGLMKDDAVLVNTSRGPIVDEAALVAGLHAGRPAVAALDVFDTEPLPVDHPLRDPALIDAGRLVLTPHIGYVSKATYEVFYPQTVEAIAAWKAGRPVRVLQPRA